MKKKQQLPYNVNRTLPPAIAKSNFQKSKLKHQLKYRKKS